MLQFISLVCVVVEILKILSQTFRKYSRMPRSIKVKLMFRNIYSFAVKVFQLENFKLFFQFILKFRHFFPSYSQESGICFQDISMIRHFLSSCFQDQAFSSKYFQDQTFSSKLLPRFTHFWQDLAKPDIFFQDTCKNNALSSKILEVKSDRFLQKMYGSSTGY